MNRNTDLGYRWRRDRTSVNGRRLPGQINGLTQAARDDRQPTGQQPKSPEPETSPIAHDCAPDPDKAGSARNALAHPRPFWGSFPILGPTFTPSRTPTSIGFSAFRPEPALNPTVHLLGPVEG